MIRTVVAKCASVDMVARRSKTDPWGGLDMIVSRFKDQ